MNLIEGGSILAGGGSSNPQINIQKHDRIGVQGLDIGQHGGGLAAVLMQVARKHTAVTFRYARATSRFLSCEPSSTKMISRTHPAVHPVFNTLGTFSVSLEAGIPTPTLRACYSDSSSMSIPLL